MNLYFANVEHQAYFANVKHQAFPISNLNICNEFNCAIPNRLVNSRVLWRPRNRVPVFDNFTVRQLIKGTRKINKSAIMEIAQNYNTHMESMGRDGGKYLTHSAIELMIPALNAYQDTLKKFERFVSLVFKGDINSELTERLKDSMAQFIVFGQANKHLCGALSNKLGATTKKLNPTWVRNTLVGWRRKFDSTMPKELQLESIPQSYNELGQELRKLDGSEEYHILISILEKAKVLHLLPKGIDLTPVLVSRGTTADTIELYHMLSRRNFFKNPRISAAIKRFLGGHRRLFARFSAQELIISAEEFVINVESKLSIIKKASTAYNNTKTFLNKINYIKTELENNLYNKENIIGDLIEHAFSSYLPGAHYTKALGAILGERSNKYSQLYTALRGIVALAYASKFNLFGQRGVAQRLSKFDPTKAASFPFLSPSRTKEEIAFPNGVWTPLTVRVSKINLYINISDINNLEKQEDFPNLAKISELVRRERREIFFTIPIFPRDLVRHDIIQSKPYRKNEYRGYSEKFKLPFRIKLSSKIKDAIKSGANIRTLTIMPPEEPSNKLIIAITLSSETRFPFTHRSKFIKKLDTLRANIPKTQYLGSDFNEIGKHIVALATPKAPIKLDSIIHYLGLDKARKKLDSYAIIAAKKQKEVYDLFTQYAIISSQVRSKARELLKSKGKAITENAIIQKIIYTDELLEQCIYNFALLRKIKRYKIDRELLGRKEKHIFEDTITKVAMIYAYIAKKSEASYFGWDDISGISNRGLSDRLATAVSHLPSQGELKGLFREWLEDLSLPSGNVREMSPFTSKLCAKCGKKTMKPIPNDYHTVKCENMKCGVRANRHENAAQVSAQALEREIMSETHFATSLPPPSYYQFT